tara:strand:+ start:1050 stop:1343 length:294 start_codon:yes stop_codon:yes gene_type:complete
LLICFIPIIPNKIQIFNPSVYGFWVAGAGFVITMLVIFCVEFAYQRKFIVGYDIVFSQSKFFPVFKIIFFKFYHLLIFRLFSDFLLLSQLHLVPLNA